MRLGRVPGQVVRLAFIFALAAVVLLVVRQRFVPESFGEVGHYRADVVPVIAAQSIRYAGLQACAECHVYEAETKGGSYHRGLSCEGCHGAADDHAQDPSVRLPMAASGRGPCLRCHSYLAARPTGFPQIIETIHNPREPCVGCHDPHDPTPPVVPGECSACHGFIARTKSVSHHWALDCETCHETPPEHRESPRAAPAAKPAARAFCGQCHASEGRQTEVADEAWRRRAPTVDMSEHGGRYLCWQCHYPHDPEG